MSITGITGALLAGAKLLFDVARLIPGLGSILGLEPVIIDGLTLAELVEADANELMATPEWAKFVASAKAFMESKGGVVTVLAQGVPSLNTPTVVAYTPPPFRAQTPQEFNQWQAEHPNGV